MLIRVLQALQGRLLEPLEQLAVPPTKPLWLSEEEQIVTRKMLNELLQGPAKLPELNAPDKRASLSALKMQIEWNGSI